MQKMVKLSNRLILAPMADITDVAFRLLCKRYGADLVYTEMVNANAIVRKNKATLNKLTFAKEEKPIVAQLFGAKEEYIVEAAKYIQEQGFDGVDLNLGCPFQKVLDQGAGAALLKRPKKVGEIIKAMVDAVSIPVTAKIRTEKNYLEIAKIIEKAGASALAVHARKVKQGYSGEADWEKIKEIKKELSIPIIGSGDIFTPRKANEMLEIADSVMIARGCIGNPYFFKEVKDYLNKKQVKKLKPKEKLNLIWEYEKLAKRYDIYDFASLKRHALAFTKSVPCSTMLRNKISKTKYTIQINSIVRDFISSN